MKATFPHFLSALLLVITAFYTGKITAQNVNTFNGSLNYGVPLLTVPAKNGPPVNINASYSSGIRMNQTASELGLGWYLNTSAFMISRNIAGDPDDADGNYMGYDSKTKEYHSMSGLFPLVSNCSTGCVVDENNEQTSAKKRTGKLTEEIKKLNYDSYSVNTPFLSGTINTASHLFSRLQTLSANEINFNRGHSASGASVIPDLFLTNDYFGKCNAADYTSAVGSGTTVKHFDYSSGAAFSADPEGYTASTNRLTTKSYVEYFTNAGIATAVNNGLRDYSSTHTRTGNGIYTTDIGAFKVTDENGFVYHFSLPVYSNFSMQGVIPLKNDYTYYSDYGLTQAEAANAHSFEHYSDKFGAYDANGYLVPDNRDIEYGTSNRIVSNWLLTAITGPDYDDFNDDGMANEGDLGYWVAFDWGLWSKNFETRYPHIGMDYLYQMDAGEVSYLQEYNSSSNNGKITGKYATYSRSSSELYFLNKIITPTHTAVYVRDIRKDNYSALNSSYDHLFYHCGNQDIVMNATGTTPETNKYKGHLYGDTQSNGKMAQGTK